jgi:mevalonate kinase
MAAVSPFSNWQLYHFRVSGLDVPSLEITVTSDIPVGAGLGSSAAFSVALAAALLHTRSSLTRLLMESNEAMRKVICAWAFKSEKIIHGNPSG